MRSEAELERLLVELWDLRDAKADPERMKEIQAILLADFHESVSGLEDLYHYTKKMLRIIKKHPHRNVSENAKKLQRRNGHLD